MLYESAYESEKFSINIENKKSFESRSTHTAVIMLYLL